MSRRSRFAVSGVWRNVRIRALRWRDGIPLPRQLQSGRYPILFSTELQMLEEERRQNAELGVELGGLRLGLYRALLEIDDPSEMAKTIVWVSEESGKIRGG